MQTLTDFIKTNKPQGFEPRPHYSVEGDSLTFFFKNESYHGERIDDFLTVYRSLETNGLVGCQIKGLPKTLAILGDFGLTISDGQMQLALIFIACMAASPKGESKECYRELGKLAKDTGATIPAKELAPLLQ
jgi:hypothetical protein